MSDDRPVAIVGAGPVGLTTALGLSHYRIPFVQFEEDDRFSTDTKAGTILTRSLEIFAHYGVINEVLAEALRIDEIGELDRATNKRTLQILTRLLEHDTRYPFVINLPQHYLEPILAGAVARAPGGELRDRHRLVRFEQHSDHVVLFVDGPEGEVAFEASYLLACDGGRSTVRTQLGIEVVGETWPERYMLIDLVVDLDVDNPRDYPYLAYFADPEEWMVLVRQPHCWRFLYPLKPGEVEPSNDELRSKTQRFIGDVDRLHMIGSNIYTVHRRIAERWRDGRVFLMGDAAHLITPMWALGLNTGILDTNSLPWRLAWVRRGWADHSLLDAYEREQRPVALNGSGEMAEQARRYMAGTEEQTILAPEDDWGNVYTRCLLGVRLDVEEAGDWSMVKQGSRPTPVQPGDRAPDMVAYGPAGAVWIHDLIRQRFVALYFTDARRRPPIPSNASPALHHYVVSRWDAPHDSGLRDRALFDPGEAVTARYGLPPDSVCLIRPDGHIAAVEPLAPGRAAQVYERVVGRPAPET